jgi:2-dehydro-3-deoxyphosphogluconate aldolase/(4S)-4-hydroxy-2-oxoglutarate aldolase
MQIDSVLSISPVIPVVTIHDAGWALPLSRALLEGGIAVIEVTLRSPAAMQAIEQIAAGVEGMTVLAGTVGSAEQVRDSLQAGAAALVSPGITERLAAAMEAHGATWLPGVATASDVMRGRELGLTRFKLFPASAVGGPALLRGFAGPFPEVRFCPTGGIEAGSAATYLALANVPCVGGSWVASDTLVRGQQWDAIRRNAQVAAALRKPQG